MDFRRHANTRTHMKGLKQPDQLTNTFHKYYPRDYIWDLQGHNYLGKFILKSLVPQSFCRFWFSFNVRF